MPRCLNRARSRAGWPPLDPKRMRSRDGLLFCMHAVYSGIDHGSSHGPSEHGQIILHYSHSKIVLAHCHSVSEETTRVYWQQHWSAMA